MSEQKRIRRSVLEQSMGLLALVNEGTHNKTRLMYNSNLSYRDLVKRLDDLVQRGLVEERESETYNTKNYFITEKGEIALEKFRGFLSYYLNQKVIQ